MYARIGNLSPAGDQEDIGYPEDIEYPEDTPKPEGRANIFRLYHVFCKLLFATSVLLSTGGTILLFNGGIREHGVLAFWLFTYIFWAMSMIFGNLSEETQKQIDAEVGLQYVLTQ